MDVTTHGSPRIPGRVKLDTLLAGGVDLDRFFAISISLADALADPLSWFHCHLAEEPPRSDDRDPQLPRIVADIILELLAKPPADRYQSAEGLARDLTRCREIIREDKTIPAFVLGERDFTPGLQIPGLLYGPGEPKIRLSTPCSTRRSRNCCSSSLSVTTKSTPPVP